MTDLRSGNAGPNKNNHLPSGIVPPQALPVAAGIVVGLRHLHSGSIGGVSAPSVRMCRRRS